MRILVTGASGFVGQHVTRLLRSRGDEVQAWGHAEAEDAHVADVDLRDPDAVARHCGDDYDAVIHLAALADVGRSFSAPARYIADNPAMLANLLQALMDRDARPRVLIVSTGAVYRSSPETLTERSATAASSPYVIGKLAQELVAEYYAHRGFEVMIARPFNHAGPGQQRGFLVADIASQIATLERDGGGRLRLGRLDQARDYTDVRDVAAAYVALLDSGRSGETYNVCSGRSVTAREIVDQLVSLTTSPIGVETDPALIRPVDHLRVSASNQKLAAETGWQPRIPLRQTLSDALSGWREAVS